MPSAIHEGKPTKEDVYRLVEADPEFAYRLMAAREPVFELKEAVAALPHTTSPETAQRIQATENAWRSVGEEFGLLTATEVAARVGKAGRSYTHQRRRAGELLAVRRGGRDYYPGFQVTPEGPIPVMAQLAQLAAELEVREASVLLWMVGPTTWWVGANSDQADRPVDHLDDPTEIVKAFRSTFGDWD